MKRAYIIFCVAIVLFTISVGCRKGGRNDSALRESAESIVRQMIVDEINENLDAQDEHVAMRLGDLHFAVASTGVLSHRLDRQGALIEVYRQYDMLDMAYKYGPQCLTIGKPITRKNSTTVIIHYKVPTVTIVKEGVAGTVLCDSMPTGDDEDSLQTAIRTLQAKLPDISVDHYKMVELDSGDEQMDVFAGNLKVKWDEEQRKWIADVRQGGNIDAEIAAGKPRWDGLSEAAIDAMMKARGFKKSKGRYVTEKAMEYIKCRESGLTYRDGEWLNAELERQRGEEERLLRETLRVVRESVSHDAVSKLIHQTCEAKLIGDALRRECMEAIRQRIEAIGDQELPEERTLEDLGNVSAFKEVVSLMRTDEKWRNFGLGAYAPKLEEKIVRRERNLREDLAHFKAAMDYITVTGRTPSDSQISTLRQVLTPVAQKTAYSTAIKEVGKYISMSDAGTKVRMGNFSPALLSKLPSSAVAQCGECGGSGDRICPFCHNTRRCHICNGSGRRITIGFKSPHNPEGLREIPCSKTCSACVNVSSRKCQSCNGSGRIVNADAITKELQGQAIKTKAAIEQVISALSNAIDNN